MGERVKNRKTGEILKIGVQDECFYPYKKLLELKAQGYEGPVLDDMLSDPGTLYKVEEDKEKVTEIVLSLPAKFEHRKIQIGKNGYLWNVNCPELVNKVVKAYVVGERIDIYGRRRTILACHACNSLFSLSHVLTMYLRQLYPEYKEVFNSRMDIEIIRKSIAFGGSYKDLELSETLVMMISLYDLSYLEFTALFGEPASKSYERCMSAVLKSSPSVKDFYGQARMPLSTTTA